MTEHYRECGQGEGEEREWKGRLEEMELLRERGALLERVPVREEAA